MMVSCGGGRLFRVDRGRNRIRIVGRGGGGDQRRSRQGHFLCSLLSPFHRIELVLGEISIPLESQVSYLLGQILSIGYND